MRLKVLSPSDPAFPLISPFYGGSGRGGYSLRPFKLIVMFLCAPPFVSGLENRGAGRMRKTSVAQHSEAPEKFHFWTGVSVIAGALRRRVWIDMGYFQWTPNFFIIFVSPPGVVSKSTTASIGMDLLGELPYIHFGPAAGTWQGLVKEMANSSEEFPMPNSDEILSMSAITIVAAELGTFLDPRNRELIDVLVSLWDGKPGPWTKITKGDGKETIKSPWINIIGCTTPSWIAENFTDYFYGGGLASRSIFVYAEKKRKLVAYPFRHLPPDNRDKQLALIHDLEIISNLLGPYELSPEALEWGEAWYTRHNTEGSNKDLLGEKFSGYLARKQTHIHKLSMVIAASTRNDLIITAEDLTFSEKKVTELELDMPQVFGQMNRETEMIMAADVLAFLRHKNGEDVTKMKVYHNFVKIMSFDTFEKILRSLMASGMVAQSQAGNTWVLKSLKED